MATVHTGEGDRAGAWAWGNIHPTGVTDPADVDVTPPPSHATSKIGGQSGPAVPIQQSETDVVEPGVEGEPVAETVPAQEDPLSTGLETLEEKVQSPKQEERAVEAELLDAQKEELSTAPRPSEEKDESAKQEEPQIEPQEEKKSDDIEGTTQEEAVQAGDKRKADEVAGDTEDQEAKKLKTSDSTKQPEVAKPAEKKSRGPKKEKKEPRVGTATRKTRSQGTASDVAGL